MSELGSFTAYCVCLELRSLPSAGVKPGLPPWGPHVRFRRVQTLVQEEQSVAQAAQFCFVYWVISRMLPVGL